jgi:predicted O-linked N-acetylglucosamine transferase (SPINDLY family)
MNPQIGFLLNKSLEALRGSNLDLAELYLKQAKSLQATNPHVLRLLGVIYAQRMQYTEALKYFNDSLKALPKNALALSNLGNVLLQLKEYNKALDAYDKSLKIDAKYEEAWSNKGNALYELKRNEEAITCHDKALSLNPNYAEAWSNKGNVFNALKRYDEAIACHDQALSLNSNYAEAWSNKGHVLNELKRYDEAVTCHDRALSLKPDIPWGYGDLLHTKMRVCNWSGFEGSLENITHRILANEKVTNPLPLLCITDNALLHQKSSEIYIQSNYSFNSALGPIQKRLGDQKIRVAYFSADFHNHATGYLMAELFELHDKNQFELVGFSFGPIAGDEMRQRIEKSFDQFIEVGNQSDMEIAQLSRDLNIDIAVDLKGFTQDLRTGILANRAAPIQVNYLGYPGTMGVDYMDYIIADKTLIPQEAQQAYSEKIAYLSNSYQVNDRKRLISDRQFTRQELGLPENGFVFCCFNNNFKILPATFAGWMRILKTVEGSVLWLFQDNSWAVENLKQEALNHGVDPSRLVFAERMPLAEHLARHRQADLFLDTFPYNAHTTTSDALWTGLPVLTLMGNSFASRVAASLLNAIGLPELISNSQEEYEALAIELASNPEKLIALKQKLANNKLTTPLFDTPQFTKGLEQAYVQMYERYQADLPPEHLLVE